LDPDSADLRPLELSNATDEVEARYRAVLASVGARLARLSEEPSRVRDTFLGPRLIVGVCLNQRILVGRDRHERDLEEDVAAVDPDRAPAAFLVGARSVLPAHRDPAEEPLLDPLLEHGRALVRGRRRERDLHLEPSVLRLAEVGCRADHAVGRVRVVRLEDEWVLLEAPEVPALERLPVLFELLGLRVPLEATNRLRGGRDDAEAPVSLVPVPEAVRCRGHAGVPRAGVRVLRGP